MIDPTGIDALDLHETRRASRLDDETHEDVFTTDSDGTMLSGSPWLPPTLAALLLAAGCRTSGTPAGEGDSTSRSLAQTTVSVVTLNIWHDRDPWSARMDYMVLELRRLDPDVIGLQEVLQHESLPNQAETIARELGLDWYFSSVDPEDRPRRYGNAILTKHRVLQRNWKALTPLDDYRNVAHARIAIGGTEVDVYNTHLHHTGEGSAIRREQIEGLLAFVRTTRGSGPVILLGDFNTPTDSPEMRLLDAAYADAFGSIHTDPAARARTTLNPQLGHTPRRIDHIYFERGRFVPLAADILLEEPDEAGVWASDHFGVIARLRVGSGG